MKNKPSPKIAHVDFLVDREKEFVRYVRYLSNPWHVAWRNFLVGTFQGLGFMIGTALVLTFLGFLLGKVFVGIPFIQDFSQAIEIWLENTIDESQL